MRPLLSLLLFFLLPSSLFASSFDLQCFREVAVFSPASSLLQVGVSRSESDIVFTQEGNILSSRILSSSRVPSVEYKISGVADLSLIQDSDPLTYIQIDPYILSGQEVSWILDLSRVYTPGSIDIDFDITSPGKISFAISEDGISYLSVTRDAIRNFPVRFIRIIFEKTLLQSGPVLVRGIRISENIDVRYLIETQGSSDIRAYRGSSCRSNLISPILPEGVQPSSLTTLFLEFRNNPIYRDDSDNDGISNLDDNCVNLSNPLQEDRNFDGRGDICSDDDGDSIFGLADNCPTLSNPDQKDQNANRVGDACEFDTDGDSIPDGTDNAIRVSNPDQKDTDRDDIGDVIDNCSLYNPDQLDLDGNARGDVCDRDDEYRKTNDGDRDGILDFSDNCRVVSNPDQNDRDGDGIGDVCDNCLELRNPDQEDQNENGIGDACEDVDGDNIVSWRDNCPTLSNPDQSDRDNNGIGDVCSDIDRDSIFDGVDNCPLEYNPNQENIDKDATGDVCDREDDRLLEKNKTLFIVLLSLIALVFIGMIGFLLKKIS